MRRTSILSLLTILLVAPPSRAGGVDTATENAHHELLLATLWVQRAAEYDAVNRTVFAAATSQLEAALADPTWTAAVEQATRTDFGTLPPAIILDVDETVLSNVAYQARMILDDTSFGSSTWNPWCDEEKAMPLSGAVEFLRAAAARGIAVFYVTNRGAEVRDATVENLRATGFPLSEQEQRVLTIDSTQGWGRDKTSRRTFVADRFRVLMAFGDNLGDFVDIEPLDEPQRDEVVERYASWWGSRWFMLPNPMYGSWESELIEALPREQRSVEQRLQRKREMLDPARGN